MNKRIILALGTMALCAGVLVGCGKVTKEVDINYGETYKIQDEKLEGKNNLTWESENTDVAEVTEDGTVTAKAPGKAKVDIKTDGKEVGEYTFNVSIVPIEQIVFSSDTIEVVNGNFTVVKYTLLPQDASDYGITWTSADESTMRIYDNKGEIRVLGESVGKTTLIATTENGVTAQCAVEVTPQSAYEQLQTNARQFVKDVLPIMSNFKNPSSVRFNAVYKVTDGMYIFESSAQNGFGGNTVSTYHYDVRGGSLIEWPFDPLGEALDADLITEAVHEKLGY